MNNTTETQLEQLMFLVENALGPCLTACTAEINENTKKPHLIVMNMYELYVALKKAEEIYYEHLGGYELDSFEPLRFDEFYHFLEDSTKKILKGKIPEDLIA